MYDAIVTRVQLGEATPEKMFTTLSLLQPDRSRHVEALTGLARVRTLQLEADREELSEVCRNTIASFHTRLTRSGHERSAYHMLNGRLGLVLNCFPTIPLKLTCRVAKHIESDPANSSDSKLRLACLPKRLYPIYWFCFESRWPRFTKQVSNRPSPPPSR